MKSCPLCQQDLLKIENESDLPSLQKLHKSPWGEQCQDKTLSKRKRWVLMTYPCKNMSSRSSVQDESGVEKLTDLTL